MSCVLEQRLHSPNPGLCFWFPAWPTVPAVPHTGQQGASQGCVEEPLRKWKGLANHTALSSQRLLASLPWPVLACRATATLTSQLSWRASFAFVPTRLPLYVQAPHLFTDPGPHHPSSCLHLGPGTSNRLTWARSEWPETCGITGCLALPPAV